MSNRLVSVSDVAAYILRRSGPLPAMKLQKLVYYCQAWSLVWDDQALFREHIEAWANGPVAPELYSSHRGKYKVGRSDVGGDPRKPNRVQRETIEAVLDYYGDKTSHWLSDLTHSEAPWRKARKGLRAGQRGSQTISHASMAEYYGGL